MTTETTERAVVAPTALETIIQAKDKPALDDYAKARGITLDGRRSFDNMLADFRAREETGKEPDAVDDKLIEVQIVRKYAPMGFENVFGAYIPQPAEIKETVAPGTVMRLPSKEAQRAISLGIAVITANSFAS
jgi:hypothetical protein